MRLTTLHPDAREELAQAIGFYDEEATGLGAEFAGEVAEALRFVDGQPQAGAPLGGELRRWRVRRFPYYLVYSVQPDRLYVLAVAHQRRRPGYWRDRR